MKTTRKQNLRAAAALLLGALSIAPALAQEAKSKPAPAQTLITNARIFDGKSDPIPDGMNVLIEGNKIARISRTALTPATGATVIDAKGRMISECNQALVRAASEGDLLQAICRLTVEYGGYRMAWVGFAKQDAANTLRP
jgi:hypothetical protein